MSKHRKFLSMRDKKPLSFQTDRFILKYEVTKLPLERRTKDAWKPLKSPHVDIAMA